MFLELSGDAKRELARLEEQLSELENLNESNEYKKENIVKSIDVLKEIIQKKVLINTDITMLIDRIIIKETDEIGQYNRPKLDIDIVWNTLFVNFQGAVSKYGVAV